MEDYLLETEELPEPKAPEQNKINWKDRLAKFTGLGPSFFEKIKPFISEEDYLFLKKEMVFYSIFTLSFYVMGMGLIALSLLVINNFVLIPLAFAFLFGVDLVSFFWKGYAWHYCISSYKSKKEKNHKSIEELAEEIPYFRQGLMKPPLRKWTVVKFCLLMILGLYIAIPLG